MGQRILYIDPVGDDVVLTEDGCETLTTFSRELRVVAT